MKVEFIKPEELEIITQVADLEANIFSDPWSAREVESTVNQKTALCAVAKKEEQVLGYFLCYYVLDECEIARIAVDKNVRRSGVGNELFQFLIEACQEKGITRILLDVRAGNEGAIAFYLKNGFATDGIRKGYYGGANPEDAVLMSMDVPSFSYGSEK